MNEANWHLSTKYTWEIIGKREREKIAARTQIGLMAGEILNNVVDELLEAGMRRYLQYKGYSENDAISILKGPNKDESS